MLQEPVIIPVSKTKLIKLIAYSLLFIAAGTWILTAHPETRNFIFNNPAVKYGAAVLSIFMGTAGLVFFIRKLTDKKPGLMIDNKGITDNASGVAAGFIPWTDVTQIYTSNVMDQKFIIIGVSNPEDYINRQGNIIKKKAMNYNYRNYDSPITITANGLTTNTESLLALLNGRWEGYKANQ